VQPEGEFFDEILRLYRHAGRDAASYRRLGRELERTRDELAGYLRDMARDYVVRLEKRLQRPGAHLTPDEIDLIWAWENLRPHDAARERLLLDDLAALTRVLDEVASLQGRRLGAKELERLRRLLGDGTLVLPRIVRALEEQEAARRLQAELGDGAATLKREALLERLRRGLSD
jgi:hypothetical protein